ncbi:MAG: hypothetical protein RLZZ70_474 [Candidatus Parcubacteria bacterium]|jgi:hypothetical protein
MKASFVVLLALLIGSVLVPQEAFALTISPTKIEVAGDPGQTIIGEIELFNEQTDTKTFFTSYENFEPRGETGSPYFVGGGSGLATWITTAESYTIAPSDRVTVPYTITIPASATPGGYFSAIFFGSQPPTTSESGGEVAIGGKVGSLVLLRVNGPVDESGGVLDFLAGEGKTVFGALPLTFAYRLNNTGGDRVVPRGELIVRNMFGGKAVTLSANQNEGSVLPNSTRRFEVLWGDAAPTDASFMSAVRHQLRNLHIGLYTATLTLVWGETEQTATEKVRIILLPWQLLTVVTITLVFLYFILKFYNRLIVARARRSGL